MAQQIARSLFMSPFLVDGVGPDGVTGTNDDEISDGTPDDGARVYLNTLDPNNKGKSLNVRESANGYVLVDSWKSQSDKTKFQELFYRHDPDGNDSKMMNPPRSFDLWSLGKPPKDGSPANPSDFITNWK